MPITAMSIAGPGRISATKRKPGRAARRNVLPGHWDSSSRPLHTYTPTSNGKRARRILCGMTGMLGSVGAAF